MLNIKRKFGFLPQLILIIIAFLFSAVFFSVGMIINSQPTVIAHADGEHTHDNITFAQWTEMDSLPTSGNYYLTNDVTISSPLNVSGTLNLCLNGHGIKLNGDGSVFVVPDESYLNIYDCDTTTEHRFTVDNATPNGAGLAVVNDEATGEGVKTFVGGYITGGKVKYRDSDKESGGARKEGIWKTIFLTR